MCGIAGLLNHNPDPSWSQSPDRAPLQRMLDAMRHRGPDDEGHSQFTIDNSQLTIDLGMRRLSIIDLTTGHQPIFNEDRSIAIVFNGEIYNFQNLRHNLESRGHHFRTRSDTEVIVHAYEEWGYRCVEHLRGMFAFAIYDSRTPAPLHPCTPALFLARDRLGIKPLYYYHDDDHFIFASEVRALLASGLVPRELDPVALWDYLGYQSVPAPRTLIQGVRALPPGTWMTVDAAGHVETNRYWDLLENASPEAGTATVTESKGRVRELLEEAVALRLISDVPLGAFLSGGIDSSAVVALMREAGHTPQTFSVVFSEGAFNEAGYAQQIATRLRTDHAEIHLTEQDLLDQLPAALAAMDQPTGDGVNTYVVSQAVHEAGMKVALSGLGGDEFFGGYPSFTRLSRLTKVMRLWGHAPAALRAGTAELVQMLGRRSVPATKAAALLRTGGTLSALFPITRQVLSPTQRRALLLEGGSWKMDDGRERKGGGREIPFSIFHSPSSAHSDPYVDLLQTAFTNANNTDLYAKISYAEARTYMHDVLLRDTDQMSMAHSLEVRVPLIDHKLAEYVIGLPGVHKHPNGTPKRLLVESLAGLLPDDIVHRPKQGFTLPFEPWMRGAMRDFCQSCLERLGSRDLFKPDAVQRMWGDFQAGRPSVTWSRLWVLVVLEEWLERNQVEMGM